MHQSNRLRRIGAWAAGCGAALVLGILAALQVAGGPTGQDAPVRAAAAQTGACEAAGLISLGDTGLCTHGPDPALPGEDAAVSAAAVSSRAICTGNGTDGRRVQVVYAHRTGTSSRLSAYLPSFRTWAAQASQIYTDSAAQTGGQRFLRFVHDSNCVIDVDSVTLSAASMADFTTMVGEMTAKGYGSSSRKYLIYLDGSDGSYCGRGSVSADDSPGTSNTNNIVKGYAVIYQGCWSNTRTISHELAHTFGAVQGSAPNATRWSHCTEEWDIMCYADGDGQPMVTRCPDPANHSLLDCRHNDYFHTNPPSTNYLYSHWNIARSGWLGTSGAPPPTTAPPNDAIGNATVVGALPFTDETNTLWATRASTDPTSTSERCWGEFNTTVWYTFTVPATGNYSFDTIGSAYDTVLGAFSGTPTNLRRLACNDEVNADSNASAVRVSRVAAGTQIYLMVGTFVGLGDTTPSASGGYLKFTAKALPSLTLSPTSGVYGTSVRATISGFRGNTSVPLTFDGVALVNNGVPVSLRTDANGTAQGTFVVPAAAKGNHTIGAAAAGASATASLKVGPRLRVWPSSAPVGATMKIALTGYAPREPVRVLWQKPNGSSFSLTTTLTVSSSGSGTYTITIPTGAAGGTTVRADGTTTDSRASAPFAVTGCPLTPTTGRMGTVVRLSCAGFQPGETVNVYWDSTASTAKTSFVAGPDGAGSASFAVSAAAGGTHRVIAKGMTSGWTATESFTVTPFLGLTQSSGPAGTSVSAEFYGFKPGETICARWAVTTTTTTTLTCSLTANDVGSTARFTFTVPRDATLGGHRIYGQGSLGSSTNRTFYVTAAAASVQPTPTPTATATPTPTPTPAPNATPVAVAGEDQTAIDEDGDGVVEVTLDGTASTDPEGGELTYTWTLVDGTTLTTAPQLVAAVPIGEHVFTLTVTDAAGATASDEMVVIVRAAPTPEPTETGPNASPTADAGEDQTVVDEDGDGAVEVTLDGMASIDPEGGTLTYAWALADGTPLAAAPQLVVSVPVGTHTFVLTVTDGSGATARDEMVVVVEADAASTTITSTEPALPDT